MLARVAAFVIWASVAATGALWLLRLFASPMPVPAFTTQVSSANAFQGDLARLFGQDAPAPVAVAGVAPTAAADPRFKLIGVVAPRNASAKDDWLAVIAFDNKPARAYAVGSAVDGDLILLSVHSRGAALGPRGQAAQVSLELPVLPPPATGTLPLNASPQAARPSVAESSRPLPPRAPVPIERPPSEPAPPSGGDAADPGAPQVRERAPV